MSSLLNSELDLTQLCYFVVCYMIFALTKHRNGPVGILKKSKEGSDMAGDAKKVTLETLPHMSEVRGCKTIRACFYSITIFQCHFCSCNLQQ